jgi:hypothetical protein
MKLINDTNLTVINNDTTIHQKPGESTGATYEFQDIISFKDTRKATVVPRVTQPNRELNAFKELCLNADTV